MNHISVKTYFLTAAMTLAAPACTTTPRPSAADVSTLRNPWDSENITPLSSIHRPSTASSIQTIEISLGSDPLLARAHEFLGRTAAAREHQQAYDGLIEDLDTIRGYMTPGSPSYDATYRWRVFVNPTNNQIEGISATYQLSLSNGKTVTLVDYHTPSESPIEGQLPSTFPACPAAETHFCMVEVNNREARGYGYYTQQGFHETILADHYYHIAGDTPERATLLILSRTGESVPLEEILRVYSTAMGSDISRARFERNAEQLHHP
ncbi:MAG: hypothetical protein IPJ69_14115 [Deltaproteobacteria bacterium]|nr:MAG: hypothetical protein IPJ69_14115 [Deltaproteobacteria bacterium]